MRTKFIAEIGYNHNGDEEIARQLIDEAKRLGFFAVKFQKWDLESLPKWKREECRLPENSFGDTYYEHRKFLEFDKKQLTGLKEYAESKGLEFVCSGKNLQAFKDLIDIKIDWIKLPSQRYSDLDVYEYLISERKKRPFKIIVSTGMMFDYEIINSDWIKEADIIMHCISKYPAEILDVNLAWMRSTGFYNGYSSHERGAEAVKYAVILGAEYIERHFTLNKNMKGSDHSISSDPQEIEELFEEIRQVERILGSDRRRPDGDELNVRDTYKKF